MTHTPCFSPQRHPRSMRKHNGGFTLLEVLVAVLVLAMIVSTAFGALRLGVRSWESGIVRANETEEWRTAADLLRRQFSQIIPLTWPDDADPRIAFDGDRDQIRFIAPVPQQRGQAGLYEFMLHTQRQALATNLVLSYMPFYPGASDFQMPNTGRQVTLIAGLKSASFSYFGKATETEPPAWHQRWEVDAEELPLLIRVQMKRAGEDLPSPDLLLAVRARHML
jgi:general secretion pathway protein J